MALHDKYCECHFCKWEDDIAWELPLADIYFDNPETYRKWMDGEN